MSKRIRDNFDVRIKKPIDKRFQCNLLSDIDTPYEGLKTYQLSDEKYYKYIDGEWVDDNNDIENIINNDITSINTSITAINTKISNGGVVNVKDYGAKGDGTTDDTQAFLDAITACPIGGKVLIPPTNNYYSVKLGTLVINKTISLEGLISGDDQDLGNVNSCRIIFPVNGTNKIAIQVNASNVNIKNITMYQNSGLSGQNFKAIVASSKINLHFEKIWIRAFDYGVQLTDCIQCKLDQINLRDCVIGFMFDGSAGTSILLNQCWVQNPSLYGYYFYNHAYCTLVNCLCDGNTDTVAARPTCAYQLAGCQNIEMVGCASEKSNESHLLIDSCNNISISNYFGVMGGMIGTTYGCSFAFLKGTGKNIVFINPNDYNPTAGRTASITKGYIGASPIIICGNLPLGYNNTGSVVACPSDGIMIGVTGLTENAFYINASDTGARKKIQVTGAGVISAT